MSRGRVAPSPQKNKVYADGPLRQVYSHYKSVSKQKSVVFDICIEDFKLFTSTACEYCGELPGAVWKLSQGRTYTYNGLDRVNPKIGYILSNVVPCCKRCNVAKNNRTFGEFITWIERVYKNMYLRG